MFNGATNFYNLNNENFHDFLMEMYRKIDLLDKDTNYIRNHLIDELRKELKKIIANGELIVDIESVVDDFLRNGLAENKVVTDIKKKLEECSSQLEENTKNRSMQKIIQKMIDKEPVIIVCYGDSVTYGFIPNDGNKTVNPYPETLQNLLREYYGYDEIYVYNEGYSGRQSDELASDEYITYVKNHTPDLVILMVGLNDKLGNYGNISSIEFYMNNLKTIKNKLAEYEILLLTPTPNYSGNGSSYAQITDSKQKITCDIYKNAVLDFAKINNLDVLDLNSIVDNYFKYNVYKRYEGQPDMLHYADFMYQNIAKSIFAFKFLPLNCVVDTDTKFDVMHGIFRQPNYSYFDEIINNEDKYNLIIAKNNKVSLNVFINTNELYFNISTISNINGGDGSIKIDGGIETFLFSSYNNTNYNSANSNSLSKINTTLCKLKYGYHTITIESTDDKEVYVSSVNFFKTVNNTRTGTNSLMLTGDSLTLDKSYYYEYGKFEDAKQLRIYCSNNNSTSIGIGECNVNNIKYPRYLIHFINNAVQIYEKNGSTTTHEWDLLKNFDDNVDRTNLKDSVINIIFNNGIKIYVGSNEIYNITNTLIGEKKLYTACYYSANNDMKSIIKKVEAFDYIKNLAYDELDSYYSYEEQKNKTYINGVWS